MTISPYFRTNSYKNSKKGQFPVLVEVETKIKLLVSTFMFQS